MFFYTKKRHVRLSVEAVNRILTAAQPTIGERKCLECGGRNVRTCSPLYTEHTKDCPGEARYSLTYKLLAAAVHERRKR